MIVLEELSLDQQFEHLKKLLIKDNVIVLDQGFRDVLHSLENEHGVIPKIRSLLLFS